MKLAALQLMQQKANKQESSAALENGACAENGAADSERPESEDGKIDDSVTGLDQVKELAETIASDDGTGIASSAPAPWWAGTGGSCARLGVVGVTVLKQDKLWLPVSVAWPLC